MTHFDDLSDLSWDAEEDGRPVRRELDRRILERGPWATALYLYQDLDPATEEWGPNRVALVRWRKIGDGWKKHASFQLTGPDQAELLREALLAWFPSA